MLNEIATELYRQLTQSDSVSQLILLTRNALTNPDSSPEVNLSAEKLDRITVDDPDWMAPPPFFSYESI